MHPILDDICRAKDTTLKPETLRRWQQGLRNEVQPALDRLEQLERELAAKKPARKSEAA